MSYLVLHMDKFKSESVRGLQSHNRRERHSHSNPDIRYENSGQNYELHEPPMHDYVRAIRERIAALNLPKTVRKDAVVMCGLIVTSDRPFFAVLPPEEQRRFFEESRDFLSQFVGKENVISAMIHMDEKTPHMHFLHVPVTPDGRLNANSIYTRESLRRLQSELPAHLQDCGFCIQRGVEQKPGSMRFHLKTREYKQQKEAYSRIATECVLTMRNTLNALYAAKELEEHHKSKIQEYEKQAREAERYLAQNEELPEASIFNFKSVLTQARRIISEQKKALTEKAVLRQQANSAESSLNKASRELEEQEKRFKRLLAEHRRLQQQKETVESDSQMLKRFIDQPEEKLRFEQFLAAQQEEERRQKEVQREKRFAPRKAARSDDEDGCSFRMR